MISSPPGNQVARGFGALVLFQAAHSVEEYLGRLWESFPPAAWLTRAVYPADQETGFLIVNLGLVGFGVWSWLVPVRRGWPIAPLILWFWVVIELINGVGHPVWSLARGGYTPGVGTAPLLLLGSLWLATLLGRTGPRGQLPGTT